MPDLVDDSNLDVFPLEEVVFLGPAGDIQEGLTQTELLRAILAEVIRIKNYFIDQEV